MMGTSVNDWVEENLGNLCDIYQPKTISTRDLIESGQYPVYGANGIIGKYDKYNHENPELLITCRGATCGAVNISSPKSWINGNAMVVRPKHDFLEHRFLEYFFRGVVDLSSVITGSAQPQITRQSLSPVLLRFPSNNEQKRIAKKLDSLFLRSRAAREELTAVPRLIERYKKSVLDFYFTADKFNDWNVGILDDFITEGLVGIVRSKDQQRDTGTPYIRMNHYDMEGVWNDKDLTYVSVSSEEMKRYELQKNDIIFNTRNSYELVGKVAIWPDNKPGYVYNNNLLRLRFETSVYPPFAAYFLISPYFRKLIEPLKSATTSVCAIYQKGLLNVSFAFPNIEQQKEIVTHIEKAFAAIDVIAAQTAAGLRQLSHLETQCLNKAFRGELVPQDPNDEPASALLERIRAETTSAAPAKKARKRAVKKKA